MNSKQRSILRSYAQTQEPIGQIGKGGISPTMLDGLADALKKRELIKISVLNNSEEDAFSLGQEIAEKLGATLVEVIGHKIVLYKLNPEKPADKRLL